MRESELFYATRAERPKTKGHAGRGGRIPRFDRDLLTVRAPLYVTVACRCGAMIPEERVLCHFCVRTEALNARAPH